MLLAVEISVYCKNCMSRIFKYTQWQKNRVSQGFTAIIYVKYLSKFDSTTAQQIPRAWITKTSRLMQCKKAIAVYFLELYGTDT